MMLYCPKCGGGLISYGPSLLCRRWQCWPQVPTTGEPGKSNEQILVDEINAMYRDVTAAVARHDRAIAYLKHIIASDTREEPPNALTIAHTVVSVLTNVAWNVTMTCLTPSPNGDSREEECRRWLDGTHTLLLDAVTSSPNKPPPTRLN